MAIQLLINCKLRRSQSSLHTARRCIPNVPTYISNDHEHQNGTINSSLVGVIIGDWKFYNHQGLCFNSKRSIRVGLMDITCGLMISQDRNLIRLFVTCIVLTDWTNMDILEANILNNNKSDIIYIVVKNLNDEDIVEEEYDILLGLTVKFLCKYLNEFYKIRSIILIDEYDKIFSERLKSKTNNFTKSSLFKNNYFSDYYEFTEDVLKKVLSNFSISDSKEKSDSDNTKDGIKEKLKKKYIYSEKNKELKNLFKNNLNFDIEFLKLLCGEMIEFLFDKLSQIKYNYLTNDISYEDRWKKSKDIMYFKIQNREVLEYLRQFVDELNLNILILYSSYMLFKYLKNDSKIIFQRGKLQL
ncbi:hypothetical protein H8356DRAFT_1382030 [Neocallimastix lanati (nom. inval.)]|nr:hypothetical protein H8356DRAFT_1382030 [Neocallimastix sp. JGI-2020a]